MGGNGSKNIDWNDTENVDIPDGEIEGIAYDIKNNMVYQMQE